ncbi:MAG: OmpA family protein [Hyphomicrobium sp.]|nr:OmpA family protein [Hyphomicrobium sp.]
MSTNVERLKQLLFDSEAERLNLVAARLDELSETQRQQHDALEASLAAVSADHRDDGKLEERVSVVIDGALRRAEINRHSAVSDAVAPFVVDTVRTEIRNSQDMMVEALYPVTGRIVKAYVASAIKDLTNEINRRLETNPVMLRLQSLMSGRSVAELAIADSQKVRLEEVLLIGRGTGNLIGRWPEGSQGSNRDHVLSGVLTAINEFSNEALGADDALLRHIDLGDSRVYLRTSPRHLLAAKCHGAVHIPIEKVLDDGLLAVIEDLNKTPVDVTAGSTGPLLNRLSDDLDRRIGEVQASDNRRRAGISPVKVLAWLLGLPLVAWLAWSVYANWREDSTRDTAMAILSDIQEIRGYPNRVSVGWLGQSLTINGLVPTEGARSTVLAKLGQGLPGVIVEDEISVVPNALAHVEPRIAELKRETEALTPELGRFRAELGAIEGRVARADLIAAVERSLARLEAANAHLSAVGDVTSEDGKTAARAAREGLDATLARLAEAKSALGNGKAGSDREAEAALIDAVTASRSVSDTIGKLLVVAPKRARDARPFAPGGDPRVLVSAIEAEAEELATRAAALAQITALKRTLPVPVSLSPRQKLEAWARANAFFFTTDAEYRDPPRAKKQLDELARLVKDAGLLVRVVGYTDQIGGQDRNSPLSVLRADAVAMGLRERGVPQRLVSIIGRQNAADISSRDGPDSPNRRVEIEVGFDGEAGP